MLLVFLTGAALFLYDYLSSEFQNVTRERMKLVGAICFGVLALFKLVELIQNKNKIKG